MMIETKFNFNQKVYKIGHIYKENVTKCPTCKGTNKVELTTGRLLDCPDCFDGFYRKRLPVEWRISLSGKVDKIGVEFYSPKYSKDNSSRIYYMLDVSGVGSGTLHYEDTLFASEKEAEEECIKLNNLKHD
jgi:hypothetical protein